MDVIATAGHVDHGKSALVRALTGMEPDRWAEERRRGLTIDLGFAWTTLPSGRRLAVVDVPGHERFVGNMLAGVGSVPAALVVVAADDGWSAQTAEHVAVLDALGVRHALLAVTKADLADPAPVLADARERLAATSMGAVPGVAVSARTGDGLPDLVGRARGAARRPARTRPGGAGAALDRPRVHHPRRRHGGHRHARGRRRWPPATGCCSGTARWSCGACSRSARRSSGRARRPAWR